MTQDIRYALMFLAEVAKESKTAPLPVKKVADSHKLSLKFLEQVVGKLRQAGILWVYRGRNGGYGLETKRLSVAEVYQALGHKPQNLFCRFPSDCRGGAECVEKELEAKIVGQTNDLFAKTSVVIPSEGMHQPVRPVVEESSKISRLAPLARDDKHVYVEN